jgi:hypothetical protein
MRMHLEWIVLVLAVAIYLYIRSRRPSARFWRAAATYPEVAFQWFTTEECWHVAIEEGEDTGRPSAEWTGPFRLYVPSLDRTVRIYGRYPDFEQSQSRFLARAKDAARRTVS